jgi:hypothetical protein
MKKDLKWAVAMMAACLVIVLMIESCYYDHEDELYPTTGTSTCDSTDTKFSTFVSPLMSTKCASSGCHSAARQGGGINLEGYAAIKAYIVADKAGFICSIKHTSGYSQMPKGDAKFSDCNIRKLEIWIANGMLNN